MQNYRFSMTGASLMIPEFIELANALKDKEFNFDCISNIKINREREATRKRKFSELILRLKQLTNKEIQFLSETSFENQKLIIFLANIRLYRILREFVEEVMVDKLMVYDDQLSNSDWSNFIYYKSIEFPEINNFSQITLKKTQQIIFKILEQAGLIDSVKSKKIQIPFLDFEIQNLLTKADQKYLLNL